MRPVRLEVEGFGTFRDRTVVDFADLDLVAFVGPTGSGKSTVIDAITFALYGSVARYDNPSLVAPVIHQLSTEAKVRFDFEVGGDVYTAVRVVRRLKSKPGAAPRASTKEARLERRTDPDGDGQVAKVSTVLAGSVSELDEEVVRLLGLDFRQFTRTIVLPQGDFAEFLTDDPGNRQKLLRRLLDIDIYARMGALARERAAKAAQQIEVYEGELGRLAAVTPDRLADAEALAQKLTELQVKVGEQLVELAELETALTERRDAVNRLDADLKRLAGLAVPDGIDEIDAATAAAKSNLIEAEGELAERRRTRDTLAERHAALGDPTILSQQLAMRTRHADLVAQLDRARSELASGGAARADADAALAVGQETLEAAQQAAATARSGADAADWVARLVEGESCPVCHQTVTEIPEHVGHDELREHEASVAAAQRSVGELTTTAAKAGARHEAFEARAIELARTEADLTDSLATVPAAEELTALLEAAAAAADERATVATAVTKAEAGVVAAGKALDDAEGAESRFRRELLTARDRVADLDPPAPTDRSLADDWQALTRWSEDQREALTAARAEIAQAGKDLAAEKAQIIERLTVAVEPVGVTADPATLATSLAAERATAERDLDHLRDRLAHKSELAATVATLTEARVVDDALGRQHLSAGGFERWLLAEALDDIVARATLRLNELSNGRYSLEADGGSFHVRDHGNADERRDVRTLSGGETFLASLALALALADSIAELAPVDSPRLSSIFLDEGFGTLDGETLDVLASAIEELSASGRLVAIVTHVRDLAERMPVRFEVRKGSTTSTIERSDG
jgi:exonuclease SbcC